MREPVRQIPRYYSFDAFIQPEPLHFQQRRPAPVCPDPEQPEHFIEGEATITTPCPSHARHCSPPAWPVLSQKAQPSLVEFALACVISGLPLQPILYAYCTQPGLRRSPSPAYTPWRRFRWLSWPSLPRYSPPESPQESLASLGMWTQREGSPTPT